MVPNKINDVKAYIIMKPGFGLRIMTLQFDANVKTMQSKGDSVE